MGFNALVGIAIVFILTFPLLIITLDIMNKTQVINDALNTTFDQCTSRNSWIQYAFIRNIICFYATNTMNWIYFAIAFVFIVTILSYWRKMAREGSWVGSRRFKFKI